MINQEQIIKLNPKNILVRMPNWLGDLIMATPILKDLRHHWPEAKITACCQGALSTVIQGDPNIDSLLSFKRSKGFFDRQNKATITNSLKKGQYDLGILLTNSFSSAWMFYWGKVLNRVGFADHYRTPLLTYPIPFPATRDSQHLVITYKKLLNPLGISVSNTEPKLYVSEQEKSQARTELCQLGVTSDHILIGINPGAAYGSAKCWLPDRFKKVVQKLLENPRIRIIFFGDQAGASLVKDICNGLPDTVINLAGRTSMRELIAFVQQCQIFLTNDSGPMHMASALGIPLLALFGSTSDTTTGPYKGGTVIHKHVICSPCYLRECPIDFQCMKQIGVEEVYKTLQDILNKT